MPKAVRKPNESGKSVNSKKNTSSGSRRCSPSSRRASPFGTRRSSNKNIPLLPEEELPRAETRSMHGGVPSHSPRRILGCPATPPAPSPEKSRDQEVQKRTLEERSVGRQQVKTCLTRRLPCYAGSADMRNLCEESMKDKQCLDKQYLTTLHLDQGSVCNAVE